MEATELKNMTDGQFDYYQRKEKAKYKSEFMQFFLSVQGTRFYRGETELYKWQLFASGFRDFNIDRLLNDDRITKVYTN